MKNYINKAIDFAKASGKKAVGVGIGIAGLGIVAYAGHHLGFYDMTPIFEMLNFNPAEFAWGAGSITALSLGGKSALVFYSNGKQYDRDLSKHNTEVKLKSEKLTQDKLDRNFKLMTLIIENDLEKNVALANMEIAPESIKQLGVQSANKLKQTGLDMSNDIVESVLDTAEDVVEDIFDKGLEIGTKFINSKLGL